MSKVHYGSKKAEKRPKLEVSNCTKRAFHRPGLKLTRNLSQSMGNIWSKYGV